MKYPSERWPGGVRGAGTIFAPPAFKQDDGEYFKSANENVIFIAQVESRLGVENCEEIAAVDGVGVFFFNFLNFGWLTAARLLLFFSGSELGMKWS